MNPREQAISRPPISNQCRKEPSTGLPSEEFASAVFSKNQMRSMLPPAVFENLEKAMDGVEAISPENADAIAVAMKEWAISHGATHYTHWFQPLTGASAEKHDAFIEWSTFSDNVIEKFTGNQLLQGEPDASSFPSGGLRTTYEARGYTGWDPTSPAFIWKGGDGVTLCIPSVFFSWTGDILDAKIPVIRSEKKLSKEVIRLLKLTGVEANYAFTTLGLEQEYFVIDRALKKLRPDLMLAGRTVYGAPPPKGQELQDHYFGTVKDRVLSFMSDFENKSLKLGIPLKTRHNEVAPAQHEVAPVYEKTTVAIDHNILLMEIMRQTAEEHGLACLLHEKPFAGINGSGKHFNWSVITDTGINLLDPTATPENNLHFLVLLTATLHAVDKNAELLRASIASRSNDTRLGGHEAPPAIISVYLGRVLEELLENIEEKGFHKSEVRDDRYQFSLTTISDLPKHTTDRNRTSPFAFTGNKFEFRALGSIASPAFSATVLNSGVAKSLSLILDEIEESLKEGYSQEEFLKALTPVLQKYLKESKRIRFTGDNYSNDWVGLAKERNLPNLKKSTSAFASLKSSQAAEIFEGILTKNELESRYEISMETYIQTAEIEIRLMLDMFHTLVVPAVVKTQKDLAKLLVNLDKIDGSKVKMPFMQSKLENLSRSLDRASELAIELEECWIEGSKIEDIQKKGDFFANELTDLSESLREEVDYLERYCFDEYWPLPKYRELLFHV